MAYTLINYSCFAASFAKSPGTPPPLPHQLSHPSPPHTHIGWRPAFKLYNQWVALVGAVICLAIMFIIRWYYALITLAIVAALYKLLDFLKPGRGLSLRVWSHHTPPCMCVVPSYPPMHVCGPIIPPHACVWSHHTPPHADVNWGSSTQAFLYSYSLKNLLKLEKLDIHVKNFR